MKRNNKKGFTIVELVIVIAVIAILSAVLIPTFAGITEKAKKSAALQNATQAVTAVIAEDLADPTDNDDVNGDFVVQSGNYYFVVTNYQISANALADLPVGYSTTAYAGYIADLPDGISIYVKA